VGGGYVGIKQFVKTIEDKDTETTGEKKKIKPVRVNEEAGEKNKGFSKGGGRK
jgi:hypothetical protein